MRRDDARSGRAGRLSLYCRCARPNRRHPVPTAEHAFGPGEAEYVAQLKSYDAAFGKFFARLRPTASTRTIPVRRRARTRTITSSAAPPSPANCDGSQRSLHLRRRSGEITASINRLLVTQRANATRVRVHSDDAPTVYINGNPAPTDAVDRTLEHDLDALVATNPITGNTDKLVPLLADQAEMKLLHMVTSSPARTPTFTMFGNANYFFQTANGGACVNQSDCVAVVQGLRGTTATSSGTSPGPGRRWWDLA